ncbi:MAG: energy transducer TonB, partial [Alphaproteobacteria bacterium]|nr:energy transducer TonB [Alphaproteobacteria bacterium]
PNLAAGQNGKGLLPATNRPSTSPHDPWDFSTEPPKLAASDASKPSAQPLPPVAAQANNTEQTTSGLDKSPQTAPAISGPVRSRITAPSSSSEGTVLVAPLPIYHPRPPYPKLAEAQGLTGRVVIRVLVSTEGKILRAEVAKSSGSNMLDEAARRGVLSWKFKPGRQASGAVNTAVDIPIDFTLDDGRASSR